MWYQLQPLDCILHLLLKTIKSIDEKEVFGLPVNTKEVPDYLDIVRHPMDISTMQVIIRACMYFNSLLYVRRMS